MLWSFLLVNEGKVKTGRRMEGGRGKGEGRKREEGALKTRKIADLRAQMSLSPSDLKAVRTSSVEF